jgi:hypothetical protein
VCNEPALAAVIGMAFALHPFAGFGLAFASLPNFVTANIQVSRLKFVFLNLAVILQKAADTDLVVTVPDYECHHGLEPNTGYINRRTINCTASGDVEIIDTDQSDSVRTVFGEAASVRATRGRHGALSVSRSKSVSCMAFYMNEQPRGGPF